MTETDRRTVDQTQTEITADLTQSPKLANSKHFFRQTNFLFFIRCLGPRTPSSRVFFRSPCAEKWEDPFVPDSDPLGFFPPAQRSRPAHPFVADGGHLPASDCFVPNSSLARLLFPEMDHIEATISQMKNTNQSNQPVNHCLYS